MFRALRIVAFKLLLLHYQRCVVCKELNRSQADIFISSHSNGTNDFCPGQCAMDLVNNLRYRIGDNETSKLLDLNYNTLLFALSNSTILYQFCQEFYKFEYCCSLCTPSYSREILMGSSQSIEHVCVYNFKDIKEHFGCLAQINSQMRKLCVQNCTPHQEAFHSIARNFRHFVLNGDVTVLQNYLNESCEYVVCSLHCDVPLIVFTCNYEIAEKFLEITRNSFAAIKKISLDTQAIARWPQACAEIISYSLPKKKPEAGQDQSTSSTMILPPRSNSQRSKVMIGLLSMLLLSFVCW